MRRVCSTTLRQVAPGLLMVGLLANLPSVSLAQAPAAPVVVSPAIKAEVHSEQMYVGTVTPEKRAAVGSAVDGRVISFPLNEGDRVEAGGTLAQLLTETITQEIATAKAELEQRRHELEELQNGTRPEEIEQARAQMEAARSAMNFARSKYERGQNLSRQQVISEEELDDLQTIWVRAMEVYNERVAAYALAKAGPRVEQIRQAEARVTMQEAVVKKLEDQHRKHTMISRFAGYVVAEHTEVGAWVNRGDIVAEVVALDRIDVLVNVLESHIPHVHMGAVVRVNIPALEREFEGKVVHIVPQADMRTRTFPVKVQVENEFEDDRPIIKAGMLARAYLPTGPKQSALLVAKDALVLGGPQPMVCVVEPGKTAGEGTVRMVPVQPGAVQNDMIAVTGELTEGALVVILGNERLRPGQAVSISQTLPPGRIGPQTKATKVDSPGA